MDCLFCNIVKDSSKSKVIYEDEVLMVIMDIFPICDGHLLIIPKEHYETVFDAPDEVILRMYKVAKKMIDNIFSVLGEKGATFSVNYGDKQEIKHLHMHVMPNFDKKPSKKLEEVYKLLMDGLNEKKN